MARVAILGIISLFLFGSQFRGEVRAQQNDFQQYMQQQQAGFDDFQDAQANYKEEITQQYQEYIQQQRQAYEDFKEEVERKWDNFRGNTIKEFVNYDKNLNSRGAIDFEDGKVEVEVIEETDNQNAEADARQRIASQIQTLVNETDEKGDPILKDQIKDDQGKVVNQKNVETYAKEVIQKKKIRVKTYQAKDGTSRKKYTVTVKMVPDHVAKRASIYKTDVIKEATRFKIDPRVAFAVIQTESYFNPKARSHIPAYGLMQLVPSSGARDAYLYVYKQDKLLSADYLYQPDNNLELGCAYLGKMRYVYFRNIKDDRSAYYCTIAAYNTGPGNVARALSGKKRLDRLVEAANAHDADWVYKKLVKDLPYEETRDYLKKVTDRMSIYDPWI